MNSDTNVNLYKYDFLILNYISLFDLIMNVLQMYYNTTKYIETHAAGEDFTSL